MRRLSAWLAGAAGGLAAYRLLRRRGRGAAEPHPEPAAEPDPRAEELRAKLAETPAEPAAEGVEDRRRGVHEHGRAAIDEMRSDGSPPDD